MKQNITWFKDHIKIPVAVKLPDCDDVSTVTYHTRAGAEAHFELQKKGYVYSEIVTDDFDLPEVTLSKPTVHHAGNDSVCVSCEG